jgi:replication-associated recombination protein RarA
MEIIKMFKQILKSLFGQTETTSRDIFENVYGLEIAKRLIKQLLHAIGPVSAILDSIPGLAKTEIVRCIAAAYSKQSILIDGTNLTAAGLTDVVYRKYQEIRGKQKIFLLIDEIEKSKKECNQVLLNIIEGGRLTKTTKTESYDIPNVNVSLIGTCNDMNKLKKDHPALVSRIMIIHIEKPTDEEFMLIAVKRLARENIPAEIASDIATQVLAIFGPDMRKVVQIAKLSGGADIDQTIQDMKSVSQD